METLLNLNEFKANTHSQSGEDGILEKLFQTLAIERGHFCEFGAWDGVHLSNAYNLYCRGWKGCYIEGDRKRHEDLLRNITRSDVAKVCAFVSVSGDDSLDNVLVRSKIFAPHEPIAIDLLSIDIDSDDLAVWRSVKGFRPRVVVIEYNPTIPIDVFFENPAGENKGNSARSIFEYARSIDYAMVGTTTTNLVFVERRTGPLPFRCFELSDEDLSLGVRYFFGYDGTLITKETGPMTSHAMPEFLVAPWAGSIFKQPVSRYFRQHDRGRVRDWLNLVSSAISAGITSPLEFARFTWNKKIGRGHTAAHK